MPRSKRKPTAYNPEARLQAKALSARLAKITPPADKDPLPARGGKDTEVDDKAELLAVREELKRADQAVLDVSSESFHCTLVFLTQSQRDAFLAAAGWIQIEGGRYIDGVHVAQQLGIELPNVNPQSIRSGVTDKKCVAVGIVPDYPA